MLHKINTLGLFRLTVAGWVQRADQGILQLLCQLLAAGSGWIKHLSAPILAVGKGILMNADQDSMFRFVDDAHPFPQVRDLLSRNGFAGCVNGNIAGADHQGLMTQ